MKEIDMKQYQTANSEFKEWSYIMIIWCLLLSSSFLSLFFNIIYHTCILIYLFIVKKVTVPILG